MLNLEIDGIELDELNQDFALQSRIDYKFILPVAMLESLLEPWQSDLRKLTIADDEDFDYHTTYFETPDQFCYRQHLQSRRQRFKIRERIYLNSQLVRLEVKTKEVRSRTVKMGIDHAEGLDADGKLFLRESLTDAYGSHFAPGIEEVLAPYAQMRFQRQTLASQSTLSRITIDTNLSMSINENTAHLRDDLAIVEMKFEGIRNSLLQAFVSQGFRPIKLSKYASAVDLLAQDKPRGHSPGFLRRHFVKDLLRN